MPVVICFEVFDLFLYNITFFKFKRIQSTERNRREDREEGWRGGDKKGDKKCLVTDI
jgi:hypothetical protein